MITSKNFGPIKVAEKPDFPLHELCTWIPAASDSDFHEMKKVTEQIGGIQNNPITIWDGKLLDGRNRQNVCKLLGMPLEYREFTGNYEQARWWVWAVNVPRRHLTASQRAAMAVSIIDIDQRNGYGAGGKTEDVMARGKVSRGTAERALQLKRRTKESDPDAIERVMHGKSTLTEELARLEKGHERLDLSGVGDIPVGQRIDESDDFMQDISGFPVPECLLDIWKSLGLFYSLKGKIEDLLPDMKRLLGHPAGMHAISPEYLRSLKDLLVDLDGKKPGHVCPHCLGDRTCGCVKCLNRWKTRGKEGEQACNPCNGQGYLYHDEPLPDQEWFKQAS